MIYKGLQSVESSDGLRSVNLSAAIKTDKITKFNLP